MARDLINKIGKALRFWYIPLIIGMIFLITGVMSILNPGESFVTLSALFSFSFIASGVMEIFFALSNRRDMQGWGWHFAGGIFEVFLGMLLINNPGINVVFLSLLVGFFVLSRSVNAISKSIELKGYGEGNWILMMALGALGIIFSFMIFRNLPLTGSAAVVSVALWIGLSLISIGLFCVNFSLIMRKLKNLAS